MSFWINNMDDYQTYGRELDPERSYEVDETSFRLAGIPRRYYMASLARIPEKVSYRAKLMKYAENIIDNLSTGRGVILTGDFGRGKTSAGVCLLAESMHCGAYTHFVPCLSLNDIYKSHKEEYLARRNKIEKIQFLQIDDVGAARTNDFGLNDEIIERIVRARYDAQLSTIITSNLSIKDLVARYRGIATILVSEYELIVCSGINWRRTKMEGSDE